MKCLANDVVTTTASRWFIESIDRNFIKECLPLLRCGSPLYELALDNSILELRGRTWDLVDWDELYSYPKDIIVELFKREKAYHTSFGDCFDCFDSICHYHEHEDDDEQGECVEKTERGRNLFPSHPGPWEQTKWRW
jgi:hypothetical protein